MLLSYRTNPSFVTYINMRKLIYHVATSLDGFICHKDGSISGFLPEGDHVAEYQAHLLGYDTVIMGRKTYTFGYDYGLSPGQPAYPHMQHYIFSRSLRFETQHPQVQLVRTDGVKRVQELKATEGSDIYLCGGGAFAAHMLQHQLIDELLIKQNPFLMGQGIGLFGDSGQLLNLKLMSTKVYESGVLLLRYQLVYE